MTGRMLVAVQFAEVGDRIQGGTDSWAVVVGEARPKKASPFVACTDPDARREMRRLARRAPSGRGRVSSLRSRRHAGNTVEPVWEQVRWRAPVRCGQRLGNRHHSVAPLPLAGCHAAPAPYVQ